MTGGKENRYGKKIGTAFLLAVLAYGIFVCMFTSTVHVDVDEELYVALARTFHYQGKFGIGDEILSYNCVLYSLLISFAYYFYTPEKILLCMRLIGVVSMCSAVFPIWLIAGKVLENKEAAWKTSCLTLFFPYMFDCAYLMQEVLSYPLFLWAVYFLYRTFEAGGRKKIAVYASLSAVFSVLCFFTKTYLFFIPVVVNLYGLLQFVKHRKEQAGRLTGRIVFFDGIYLLFCLLMGMIILMVNGFEGGSNHYSTQFSNLFPVSGQTFISGITACVLYLAFFLLNTGVIPVETVWFNRDAFKGTKRWLLDFGVWSCAFLVLETVFLIVLTEEGVRTLPHKFLFRYFQVLTPLFLILFVKVKDQWLFLKRFCSWALFGAAFIIPAVYFGYMKGNTRQAIIDGHLFLLAENVAKFICPYGDVLMVAAAGCMMAGMVWVSCKRGRTPVNGISKMLLIVIALFWLLNCVQLPVYNNIIAGGKEIQADSIKIADYLNSGDYDFVYYVDDKDEEDRYLRNFYGYIRQQYRVIDESEIASIAGNEKRKAAFVMPRRKVSSFQGTSLSGREIDLGTEKIALCLIEY